MYVKLNYAKMKSVILTIAVALMSLMLVSCLGETKNPPKEEVVEVVKSEVVLGGKIGKMGVVMKLEQEGDKYTGWYYYNKYGPSRKLNIYGESNGKGITMYEYDENGVRSGRFDVVLENDCLTGDLSVIKSGKVFRVDLAKL